MAKKEQIDFKVVMHFLKKNWNWIAIAIILVLGFHLRLYHSDYPVVSYHNWKESHYLTEARNFAKEGFFEYGIFIPSRDYSYIGSNETYIGTNLDGAHSDTLPTISIAVGLAFMVFGQKLIVARLINIFFIMGAIFMMYLFMRKLFEREDIALTTALVATINPLFIYFGRQTQLINPALFFVMASFYVYLLWREDMSLKKTSLLAICITLAVLTKYDFFIVIIPIALTLPYRKMLTKKYIITHTGQIIVSFIILSLMPIWYFYTKFKSKQLGTPTFMNIIDPSIILQWSTWYPSLRSFIADNYSILGFFFFLAGLAVFLIFSKKKNFHTRFMLAFFAGFVIWAVIAFPYIKGHSYHQYPGAPFVVMMIAYLFIFIGVNAEKIIKINHLKYLVILLLVFSLYSPSMKAKNRQFDTQFIGLDVAGEYVKMHSLPNERVMFPSHQSYGFVWHADRKGFGKGWSGSVRTLKWAEEQNATWILVYQWGMKIFENQEVWGYISDSYSLKQIAFQQIGGKYQPMYFLLRKGGSFNISQVDSMVKNLPVQKRVYDYSIGKNELMYINLE